MNALEIKDLTKQYPGFQLGPLTLTLPSGCIMGLIGENGAGKSTTIKLILELITRESGSISVFGREIQTAGKGLRQDLGVVLDETGIPECLTAKQVENIMQHTFIRWDSNRYQQLLHRLSVPEDKPFKEFSRGMKTKLGVAIALSHDPKLLLLDEPTNGLDPVVRDEVVELFGEFTREEGHAVLISSHIVSDLEKICDYIAFLHQGKLLLCQEKDRLLEQYGILPCTERQLTELAPHAVQGKKITPYGVQALVLRDSVPANWELRPVNLEELFLFMVKEGV